MALFNSESLRSDGERERDRRAYGDEGLDLEGMSSHEL